MGGGSRGAVSLGTPFLGEHGLPHPECSCSRSYHSCFSSWQSRFELQAATRPTSPLTTSNSMEQLHGHFMAPPQGLLPLCHRAHHTPQVRHRASMRPTPCNTCFATGAGNPQYAAVNSIPHMRYQPRSPKS